MKTVEVGLTQKVSGPWKRDRRRPPDPETPRPLRPIWSYDGQNDSRRRPELPQNRRNERPGRKRIRLPPLPVLKKRNRPQSIVIVVRRKIYGKSVILRCCKQVDRNRVSPAQIPLDLLHQRPLGAQDLDWARKSVCQDIAFPHNKLWGKHY